MDIQEVFSKVISKEIIGKFVLRNGLQVASDNLLNWEFGFPKYQHKICHFNININQTSYIWSYYPDGKMNISEETEFDIVDFILNI